MLHTNRALRALVASALLVLPLAAFAAAPAGAAGTLLVGFAPGDAAPVAAVTAAGGRVIAVDAALGLATVDATDTTIAMALLSRAPGVQFVEHDGRIAASGVSSAAAGWDVAGFAGAGWDSARWDSARWDSARWDSARWDSSRWDAALCDSARWDSARWDAALCDSARWDSARWDGDFDRDPLLAFQWGLAALNVPEAWSRFDGFRGRTICVVDSGVDYTHPDLADNMWLGAAGTYGIDLVNGDDDPMDDAGHGTHVAGVAAAGVGNGVGIAGVGNERIMAVKVLNHKGIGGLGNLASGIRWCADHGANVVSLSLSTDQYSKAVKRAVEYAHARGLLLVASAGNVGRDAGVAYPAAYPEVIGVAAMGLDGTAAPFSRAGDAVELAAPGELIAGTVPGARYALASGTSQSAALVAGIAALAWDVHPSLTNDALRALLVASARDVGAPGLDVETGHGIPDAAALLLATGAPLALE